MATHSFQSSPTWFQYVSDFQLEKCQTRPQTQANILICLLEHVYEAPCANMKMECQRWPEMPLILGRSGTSNEYVAMVTKLLSWNCGAHLVESFCKESNISDTNLNKCMMSSLGQFAYFKKLEHLWNKKRYLKIVNSTFLLMQATCLCFKMASIEKMQFSS